MPFRSRQTLEDWLDEFRALGYPVAGTLKVMPQDGDGGADTGLVGVRFANASTVTYVQPEAPYSNRWVATMESRDEEVVLDSVGLMSLAGELSVLSALCAFLEAKSEAHRRPDTP
ncbi:hypothetical protein [Microbacterium sp.]|jgi:hypothetical protein|uniref:hypothetical protein n=1 Tax=Microbacterium sp. TaxID=51671 RepID=UPI0035AF2FD6